MVDLAQGRSQAGSGYPIGQPLAVRLAEFRVRELDLGIAPVVHARMVDECTDGGRHTYQGKNKRRSLSVSKLTLQAVGGAAAPPIVETQDMIEEEVRVVRHLDHGFDDCISAFEEYLSELGASPVVDVCLDD